MHTVMILSLSYRLIELVLEDGTAASAGHSFGAAWVFAVPHVFSRKIEIFISLREIAILLIIRVVESTE